MNETATKETAIIQLLKQLSAAKTAKESTRIVEEIKRLDSGAA